jgi:hypothetical protein
LHNTIFPKEDGEFLLLEDGARLPVSRQNEEYLKALFRCAGRAAMPTPLRMTRGFLIPF